MDGKYVEVLIIGCGPAGATASLALSKHNIAHVLLDKAVFPRDKVCGDSFSYKGISVLQQIDPELLPRFFAEYPYSPIYGLHVSSPENPGIDFTFTPDAFSGIAPGFIAKRVDFDYFLYKYVKEKGATVHEGVVVKEIKRESDGLSVSYMKNGILSTYRCKVLIAADGNKGICRQLLEKKRQKQQDLVALRGYFQGIDNPAPDKLIELHFVKDILPGYLWIFPLPNGGANVGLGIDPSGQKSDQPLREVFQHQIEQHPLFSERFRHAQLVGPIKGWSLPVHATIKEFCADRVLYTGDAAQLVNPLTGEGLGQAILSGYMAAEAVVKAVRSQSFGKSFFHAHYAQPLWKKLRKEILMSRSAVKFMEKYPKLFGLIGKKLYNSPTFYRFAADLADNKPQLANLLRPSFYWKVWKNK
ncbi:NAD(P)/FAD-dependent oxidoreductase [Olivibacter sitiensis]|uniref:NAD(P)/FAD-dependent oxidoreductase n=1 Tax=Olivibacter sitiensis TaxID=376470 RepID=UPI000415A629|nr:NAD(P)/FAD-dependent oxidoreductase [Olivibacter sitiensis]